MKIIPLNIVLNAILLVYVGLTSLILILVFCSSQNLFSLGPGGVA